MKHHSRKRFVMEERTLKKTELSPKEVSEVDRLLDLHIGDSVTLSGEEQYIAISIMLRKQNCAFYVLNNSILAKAYYVDDVLEKELYIADCENHKLLAGYSISKNVVTGILDIDSEYAIIDLTDHGVHWEGYVRKSDRGICGWGQMYNEVNELTYSGFCINGVYTIYGFFYQGDLNTVSYVGMIDEGVPFGLGQKFDRQSNLINEGVYVCDRWMESTQVVPNIVDSSFLLSSLVESIDLTDYAFCYMPCNFSCFPHLLKIKGSSNTFYRVQSLVLEGLQNLQQFSLITKELSQDNKDYELDENKVKKVLGRMEIRNCPQLLLINIGDNCLILPEVIIQSMWREWNVR